MKVGKRHLSGDDLALARHQQAAEARAGGAPRSIEDILRHRNPAQAPPIDLTQRQLRRRGTYGAAALLTDQAALGERDQARAIKARAASATLKELDRAQLEFDFFMGNISVGQQYHDTMRDRLIKAASTPAERLATSAVLQEITRWLGWQSYACTKTTTELAAILKVDRAYITRKLDLLERVGAITRIRRGTNKIICITPEGVYRGDINKHAEAVARYRAEVVPIRADDRLPAA